MEKLLKQFATMQFHCDEVDGVCVTTEWGDSLCDPWMDQSGRFPLTDEEAIREWGLGMVQAWCEKAEVFIKEHPYQVLVMAEKSGYSVVIKNKATGREGYCLPYHNMKVKVFYGNPDGSDDKVLTPQQFKEQFCITEIRSEDEFWSTL